MTPSDLLAISREPNVSAFLRVIRACEGTAGDNGYRMLFGGDLVADLTDHPRKLVVKSGYRSTAAGAYQFLERTWDMVSRRHMLPDFTPPMQDAGAVALILGRGALDDVRAGRLTAAIEKCAAEWASLPGSPYGQPTRDWPFVRRVFALYGGREVSEVTDADRRPVGAPNDAMAGFDVNSADRADSSSDVQSTGIDMAPILAALLPSLVGLIPELAKLFGSGSRVAQRNTALAQRVAEIVVQATQAPNLQGAIESMQSSPKQLAAAQAAVQSVWYELVEVGGGIPAAREHTARMLDGGGWRAVAYGTVLVVLSLGVVIGGGAIMGVLLFDKLESNLAAQILDYFKAAGFIVLGYVFGSSADSRRKTDMLAADK